MHQFDLPGTFTPRDETYRPVASRGTLIRNYRSKRMRKWSEWQASGDLTTYDFPIFASMALAGGVTPTIPTNGVTTYDWIFSPNANADDLVTATGYFGDPNQSMFQAPFMTIDDLTISADKAGTEAAKIDMAGHGNPLVIQAPTAWKAMKVGSLIAPGNLQVWIDSASAIGTTDVTDQVVSVEHHWTNDLSYKFGAAAGGTASTLGYGRIGRAARACELTITMEFLNTDQYNAWSNEDFLKTRVRYYGSLIEHIVSPSTDFYAYITVDLYGKFNAPDLAEIEGTNRGFTFVVPSENLASVGYDWRATVQTSRADLVVA